LKQKVVKSCCKRKHEKLEKRVGKRFFKKKLTKRGKQKNKTVAKIKKKALLRLEKSNTLKFQPNVICG